MQARCDCLVDVLDNVKYRYTLTRELAPTGVNGLFVMLNPSTATEEVDDPTIRRCTSAPIDVELSHMHVSCVNDFKS